MKCTNCGEELKPTAKFCPYCGTAVSQITHKNDLTKKGTAEEAPSVTETEESISLKEYILEETTALEESELDNFTEFDLPPTFNIDTSEQNAVSPKKHTVRNIIIAIAVIGVLAVGAYIFTSTDIIPTDSDIVQETEVTSEKETVTGGITTYETEPDYIEQASLLMDKGKYSEAAAILAELDEDTEAAALYTECMSLYAEQLYSDGEYISAAAIYSELTDTEKYVNSLILAAGQLKAEEKYYEAADILTPVSDSTYEGTPVSLKINELLYNGAVLAMENGTAVEKDVHTFEKLGNYMDSPLRYRQLCYSLGEKYFTGGKYLNSYAMHTNAGTYQNAPAKANEALSQAAAYLADSGNPESAASIYAYLGNYDSAAGLLDAAKSAERRGLYAFISCFDENYRTYTFNSGNTLTAKGTCFNAAETVMQIKCDIVLTLPDQTEQFYTFDGSTGEEITASFKIPEDISGSASVSVKISGTDVSLIDIPVEIIAE